MTYVTTKTRTVYRASTGRTYLTRHGAYEACAYALINKRIATTPPDHQRSKWCECEAGESDELGHYYMQPYTCRYHNENDRKRLAKRLARWMMWRDSLSMVTP